MAQYHHQPQQQQVLTYTLLGIGPNHKLHQLHTTTGKWFFMGEVAALFQQPPNAFVQELRVGKYAKQTSNAPDVLQAVVQLGLEVETSHAGVMLLPPSTVEALLRDKRRLELLQTFKVAMLKLASQVRSHTHTTHALAGWLACSPQS